jgi:hypothetical protein
MEEYDVRIGERPEKPSDVSLADVGQDQLLEMVSSLRGVLGISDDGFVPEGTLDDLIDYLHERWDGATGDEDEG